MIYYPVFALSYLFTLVPLRVMYFLSDLIRPVVYYLIPYRKIMVMRHLRMAFPEKTEAERRKIAWSFYRNFLDYFFETAKLLSATKAWVARHFVIDNPEVYGDILRSGRRVQIHMGHAFNWEFANLWMPATLSDPFIALYMPIRKGVFDRLFNQLRGRTGANLVPATDARKGMMPFRHKAYMLALLADQAPGSAENAYWLNFFGTPTAFVRSPERGARVGNIPVLFARFYKTGRGRFRVAIEVGSENPASLPEGELTRLYVAFLERSIRDQPSNYLWTHNRWKHRYQPAYRRFWIDDAPPPDTPAEI